MFKISINLYIQIINGYIWKDCDQLNRNLESTNSNISAVDTKVQDKIVVGSYKNVTLVVSTPTVTFSNGSTTISLASIATAYKKSIVGISAQLRSASSVVVTSANFNADNAADLKCVRLSDGAGYTGSLPVTLFIYLAG